ncbi:MAG: non-canonical purine NTP pyrophosphatase [Firmicutes bacterium]|nr:non-canonical purine NTP pyrophosphatase [Bacillota bacterium]
MLHAVLATHNLGKLAEFEQMLGPDSPLILQPYPTGGREIVEETGTTYVQNAELKAHTVAQKCRTYALADDSGIEVDALDGAPGVYSANFVSDIPWENTREILLRLAEVPWAKRTARMRSVLCLAAPDGRQWLSEGVVEGIVLMAPQGVKGFGMDPIFSVDGGKTSWAQWDPVEKNRSSHRGQALVQLVDYLRRDGLIS